MKPKFDPARNLRQTKKLIGYLPRSQSSAETYSRLGFKCGLEIHQQLKTEKKLFCRCAAGRYQDFDDFDAEIVRHMRPTLSELGEYDGTALMEFKTRKNIIYRIKNQTACTYEIDDTPPFKINPQALEIAIEIALLLKTNIVGELHITRKQYLDGSIPTGFQRTAIVGIEGALPLPGKPVRVIQLSIEEDACREVSDVGHWRIYATDRLGMPLIETVTYPDMKTPEEAAAAAHYIRFLCRSTGKVRTGIGAAREDVNVSIDGGTRVEIKGVAHISWIPELTHNEGFRQKALLEIARELNKRIKKSGDWKIGHVKIDPGRLPAIDYPPLQAAVGQGQHLVAVNLPGFEGILSFFTQPGQTFADEINGRLKVIACLERPNLLYSEQVPAGLKPAVLIRLRRELKSEPHDAQLLFWGAADDVKTALETIQERCLLAFKGVPNETRQARADGTTNFERVLPGPDRMYPDTDSAPIPIPEETISRIRERLPVDLARRLQQLREWAVPEDSHAFILKRNLMPLIEKIVTECGFAPRFIATLLGQQLKNIEGRLSAAAVLTADRIFDLCCSIRRAASAGADDLLKAMLPLLAEYADDDFQSLLTRLRFTPLNRTEILMPLAALRRKFKKIDTSRDQGAELRWLMGRLAGPARGNMPLAELEKTITEEIHYE